VSARPAAIGDSGGTTRVWLIALVCAGCPAWWEPAGQGDGFGASSSEPGTTVVTSGPGAVCGNGIVETGEDCDASGEAAECDEDCTLPACGDGTLNVSAGEQCDDGGTAGGDRCSPVCTPVAEVVDACVSQNHTCVVLADGGLRCWGGGLLGQLGSGDTLAIGDEPGELPAAGVAAGGPVEQVACGAFHTCVLLAGGEVRCWGFGASGQLGNGSAKDIGDAAGELPVPAIPLAATMRAVAAGANHTCAIAMNDQLQCWGRNKYGHLGQDSTERLGDEPGELPVPPVAVPAVAEVVAGGEHTCVRLTDGSVRCWGYNGRGQLGYETTLPRGDGSIPKIAMLPDITLDAPAEQLAAGNEHTCALLADGRVACWGYNFYGQLGNELASDIGDDEDEMPPRYVDLGEDTAKQVVAGKQHSCALLESGEVGCWGGGIDGALGYGNTQSIGAYAGEMPPPYVDLGGDAVMLAAGGSSTCALLVDGTLRCWGDNSAGQLGYGHLEDIGDDEAPADAGPVPY
jgi:cysteine-rich repeat protein